MHAQPDDRPGLRRHDLGSLGDVLGSAQPLTEVEQFALHPPQLIDRFVHHSGGQFRHPQTGFTDALPGPSNPSDILAAATFDLG